MPDAAPDLSLLRHSALQNRLVLDYTTTETVGTVETLLVDVKQGQVAGLVCRTGLMGRQKTQLAWSQLESIGADSLVVRAGASGDGGMAAQSALGLEVWTDAGNKVGLIADFQFSRATGEVTWYLFAAEGQNDGLYGLQSRDILSAGRKRIMVAAAAVDQAEIKAEAVPPQTVAPQTVAQPTEVIPSDYQQAPPDWQSLVKGAKLFGKKVQQRAQDLKDYTEDHLPELQEQFQDRTQQASRQVQQQVNEIKGRLQPQGPFSEHKTEETIDIESFEVWEDD
ncbi:MAG: PRC-barrel domain-containing protein [Cyanobacteria bacterium P01_A01_bin.105]